MNRAWYLTLIAPLAVCCIGVLAFIRLVDNIAGMQRFVVPGEHALTLEARDYRVFAERESTVDGVAYSSERISVRCTLDRDGTPIELQAATGKIQYSLGGYAGRAIFKFTMPAAGTAHMSCASDDGKGVLAVGTGIGTSVVAAVLTLVLGVIATVGGFAIVYVLRRRSRKRIAAT